MKRKLWVLLALNVALTALPASAQMTRRQMRDALADDQRSVQPQQADPSQRDTQPQRREPHHAGRMSPEERRQLRRDIDDAGRELYRREPQRPLQ